MSDDDKLLALTLAALSNSALVKHNTDAETITRNAIYIAQLTLNKLKELNDTDH